MGPMVTGMVQCIEAWNCRAPVIKTTQYVKHVITYCCYEAYAEVGHSEKCPQFKPAIETGQDGLWHRESKFTGDAHRIYDEAGHMIAEMRNGQNAQLIVAAHNEAIARHLSSKQAASVQVPENPVLYGIVIKVKSNGREFIVNPDEAKQYRAEACDKIPVYTLATAPSPSNPIAASEAVGLTDKEVDAILSQTYQDLRATGWNGTMGGVQWDRAVVRAVEKRLSHKGEEAIGTVHVRTIKFGTMGRTFTFSAGLDNALLDGDYRVFIAPPASSTEERKES